jgi:hypothetical protein
MGRVDNLVVFKMLISVTILLDCVATVISCREVGWPICLESILDSPKCMERVFLD